MLTTTTTLASWTSGEPGPRAQKGGLFGDAVNPSPLHVVLFPSLGHPRA